MDIPPDVITPASLHQAAKHHKPHFEPTAPIKNNQVSTVVLYGIPIVSLIIESQERLCLAQISNTLLKEFSYNEIHNRRVALGITCVQCTPVQLEILRRAGAMPVSSRRCGMITRREAERLCKSFLGDNSPPRLPEDFAFSVYHECAWGCKGAFLPARYNSSRAKCIKCAICGLYFSPNKFIFHSHRLSTSAKYIQPDAANFNSWRRHMKLLGSPPDDVVHAWEDVKAMFNGGMCNRGTRKRVNSTSSRSISRSQPNCSEVKSSKQSKLSNDGPLSSDNLSVRSKDLQFNPRIPAALSRISSGISSLDFWHGQQVGNGVSNSAPVGLKSFPPNIQAAAATFSSMSAVAAAAMLPTWYYNYHTAATPQAGNSAFRPVYPAYLSGYLGKMSPTSEPEADGEENDGGGADGDDSHGGEDSDVTVDIETCPEEEGERDGRVEGAMSHAPSQDEKASCLRADNDISDSKPIVLDEDSYIDNQRSYTSLPKKRPTFSLKPPNSTISLWSIEKMTAPSIMSPHGARSDDPPSKWSVDPEGHELPMDCSTCHHAASLYSNNNNNNMTKEQSQN